MAIHLRENQYKGVNAHLHSYFQQRDEWATFHNGHVTHLREALEELIPFESGYVVAAETSLQISHHLFSEEKPSRSRMKPDISVYRKQMGKPLPTPQASEAIPTAIYPVSMTVEEAEHFLSIVIYRLEEHSELGTPITRIELLSPANKPPGSHFPQYLDKRDETLYSKIKLVEIDYLHERRSPVGVLPSYPEREEDAYPYTILVSNPLPSIDDGEIRVYGFRVDDPIPSVAIPLEGSDSVTLDFGAVYNHTFAANRNFGLILTDYETLPEGFDTYDGVDQQRIRDCMARVVGAHQK